MNKENAIENIIFDWSGTLSNDFDPVYQAISLIFKRLDHEPISKDTLKREMVLPYMNFWNSYFPDLTKSDQDKMFKKAINEVDSPTIYPGVNKELERLEARGVKKIIISSHVHDNVLKEAEDYGVANLFQEINGGIHDKEEAIEEILKRNSFDPKKTAYVGDMTHDIKSGKQAGVITIGISWGYKPADILAQANPDHIIDDIKELESLV